MEFAEGEQRIEVRPIKAPSLDAAAFADWVRPHWLDLHRLAVRMCGPVDGEDVLQEALAAAWRKRGTFDPDRGQARPWLLAVVADQARKQRKRVAARPTTQLADEPGAREAARSDRVDLDAAVQRLPERQRLVVSLFYYLDLPVTEIANVMSCSVGTVKSTLFDARQRLREMLGDDYA